MEDKEEMKSEGEQPEEKASQDNHEQWRKEKWEKYHMYHRHRTSRFVALTLVVVGGVIILLGAFAVGHNMGNRRAFVGGATSERGVITNNMVGNFAGRMGGMGGRHMGSSILGSVTNIGGNTLTVHNSSKDYTVTVSSTTSFYKLGAVSSQSTLKTGDVIVVSGTPDSSGNITATAISIQ